MLFNGKTVSMLDDRDEARTQGQENSGFFNNKIKPAEQKPPRGG